MDPSITMIIFSLPSCPYSHLPIPPLAQTRFLR
uniref:Uncharacterized protein n=1 Tax=Siphoviridae sp. ct1TR2 TaxID=2825309 RepID=A0A8S5NSA8_9CAUD|nr:MAG TPA: hypothetical protein [Siphoviridae sp. ct1TR2]